MYKKTERKNGPHEIEKTARTIMKKVKLKKKIEKKKTINLLNFPSMYNRNIKAILNVEKWISLTVDRICHRRCTTSS